MESKESAGGTNQGDAIRPLKEDQSSMGDPFGGSAEGALSPLNMGTKALEKLIDDRIAHWMEANRKASAMAVKQELMEMARGQGVIFGGKYA